MAGPEPRDPRARRWTIVLVLLALVVVAGVALRVVDDRRADERAADRAAEREADREATGGDDAAATEDLTEPELPASSDPAADAVDDPLGIELQTVNGVDGATAMVVQSIGPIELHSQSTLPYVTGQLGEPDASGPNAEEPTVCDASWVAWGIEASFYFGHPPSPEASCTKGPVAAALMTGDRWFIQPLTGGGRVIGVGDPVSAIETAFPLATLERLSPGLADMAENPQGYLLAEGSYGGDPYPTLYAIGVDGSIASFLYVSGAD